MSRMSPAWISLIKHSRRLEEGISLLNSLSTENFDALLTKVHSDKNFEDNELRNLEEQLGLDANELQYIIQTISYINKHLSQVILKPTDLKKQLIENLAIHENKAELLVQCWTEDIRNNFDLESKKKLQNISWELSMQTASSFSRRESSPTATMQLKVVNGNSSNNIFLRLDEEELTYLYNTLESIQGKLDNI